MQMAIIGLGNLEVKVLMNRNQRNKSQTIDFSNKRYLSKLCNNNSGLEMELV